jgi:cyclase
VDELSGGELRWTDGMLYPGLFYMGDGHVDEWPPTLEALKALDFDVLLPGHGAPARSREIITHFQAYLTDPCRGIYLNQ